MNQKWYDEYVRLGGKSSKDEYSKNLRVFIDLTCHSFTGGGDENTPTREEAMKSWYEKIGSKKEGNLYFRSVDNITAYS